MPSPRSLYATIFLLSLTEFLQAGMTAFAAAPTLGELSLDPEQFSLVAALYASVAIVAISMQRWCVERWGGRRFVQACAAVMAAGSVVCAASDGFGGFLAGRVLMALGGGAFFTASRMIIQHALAGPQRFAGIRSLGTGLALGIAAAPWLAASAVSSEAWAAIYGSIAALAVAIFLLAGRALPLAPPAVALRAEVHPWQQVLLFGASFGLLYALQRFCYDFHGDVGMPALAFAAALAGLLLYLRLQLRGARPLLRLRDLLGRRYLFGLAMFLFAYVMLGANNVVVPAMLVGTLGFAWHTVGQVEAVGLGAALLTVTVVLHLLPRSPAPRKFLVTGFAALGVSGLLLARIDTGTDLWWHVLPALALNSVFLLTVLPVTAMQTFRGLEHDESVFSHAQQLKNMMGQAGLAIGITGATLVQQWRTATHYTVLSARLNPYDPVFDATMQPLQQAYAATLAPAEAMQAALARLAQILVQQSAMLAHIDHFMAIAVLGALGMAVILRQRVFR